VTEPEDPFDTWLHTQVEPLRPPPGTYEQIKKRAKRRKMRRAVMSAASAGGVAVVIVAAIVAVPRLVPSLHSSPRPAAASSRTPPKYSPSQTATSPARMTPSSSSPGTGTEMARVPADFAPTSITFVNFNDGWVIGQAPGCGQTYCTSVAETMNKGATWTPVPAPQTGPPDGSTGVSQIRFLNASNGWAFGPQLYETHNGGQSWTAVDTYGLRVTDLETVGAMAYAVFAKCTGSGPDFAAGCTNVSVYSSPVGSDTWSPMPTLNGLGFNRGDVSGKIVLTNGTGGQGYFYAPDGLLYSGSPTQGTNWQLVVESQMPCQPFSAQPDGQPSGGQLAASVPGDLVLACPGATGSNQEKIYASSNGGQSWTQQGTLTVKGSATSLAAGTTGALELATTGGLYQSVDGGQQWQLTAQGPPGGFSYVGMTSDVQGVAVPAEPAQSNSVWVTKDAGATWNQSSLTNP